MQSTPVSKSATEVRDSLGVVHLRLTDAKLEILHNAGLIKYHGRRRITHATINPGMAVATLLATLRAGIRNRLPQAEDSKTVVQRRCGAGVYFDQIHQTAWDDRRKLCGTLGMGGYGGSGERNADV